MPNTCCPPSSASAPDTLTAKFHTALNVSDLGRSVTFYRLLLGCDPAKLRVDYAKFELAEPPLVLSLIPGKPGAGGGLNHFGLRVPCAEKLVEIQHRLELGGIRTTREEGVECCYSRQTKFWVADPDRMMWEIYVFHEDIEDHGDDTVPASDDVVSGQADPDGERVVWQHTIGEAVPERVPHEDNAVHEVMLEGTANLAAGNPFPRILADAFRALRPGGELRVHGLSADAPLAEPLPKLPGPAAVVETVPSHRELIDALIQAGFVEAQLEKLSETAHFNVGGVGLRELMLIARKPGHRSRSHKHTAVYLGPLAEVKDDFGNTFQRGVPVALNVHDFQALHRCSTEETFLLI